MIAIDGSTAYFVLTFYFAGQSFFCGEDTLEDADEVAHAFDVEADVADDGVGGGGEFLHILLLLWPAINTSA